MSAFSELGMSPELIMGIEELGWTLPTDIQAEAIPLILGGGDVMAAAETGSGKTGAFALPILQVVQEMRTGVVRPTSAAGAKQSIDAPLTARWSADDRDAALAVSSDGAVVQARDEAGWAGVRASVGARPDSGKWYYEVTVQDEGLCRVGWASAAATLDVGTDKASWGFGGTGRKSHAGAFDAYGAAYRLHDVVGVALDWKERSISYFLNGKDLGAAFALHKSVSDALYPAATLKNAELKANFGAEPWKFPPPTGYRGLAGTAAEGLQAAPSKAAVNIAPAGVYGRAPLALILEPTRDLAEQTHENVELFSRFLPAPGLRGTVLVGGTNPKAAERLLAEGVDIVSGTPGRVLDLAESGKLNLGSIRFFVLDEADRLLDTGNQDTIRKIFRRLPKAGEGVCRLQALLFSATLHSEEVRRLASEICQQPMLVDLKGREAIPESVDHLVLEVDPRADRSWLQTVAGVRTDGVHAFDAVGPSETARENWSEAVKRLKPRLLRRLVEALGVDQALVFCRTNLDCDNLERYFRSLGGGGGAAGPASPFSCAVLAGARSMDQRRAALAAFKAGEVRFLIATDVAARGIDVQGLPFVVNMTLPERAEDYVHRVGRVGRAEALGLAVSLVAAVPEKVWYATGKGARPWDKPTPANVRTHEEGGQTAWMDEGELLRAVEARLRAPIARLPEDMSLPAQVQARLQGGYGATAASAADEDAQRELQKRLVEVQPAVATLAALEKEAQASFFALKRKWDEMESVQSQMSSLPLAE